MTTLKLLFTKTSHTLSTSKVLRLSLVSLIWLLFSHSLVLASSSADDFVNKAKSYIGTTEKGNNRGELFDRANKFVGAALGSPYCTSIIFLWLHESGLKHLIPKTALARNLTVPNKSTRVVSALDVFYGKEKAQKGDIGVFQKGETIYGHAFVVAEDWNGKSGKTVEGNTSSTAKGSQSNGDGVWGKVRTISPFAYFRIKWIVKLNAI